MMESMGLLSVQLLLQIVSASFIVFLFAFVLVYVNNSPEPSSFGAKLVGLAVVAVMLAMGDLASFVLWKFEAEYNRERRGELALYMAGIFTARIIERLRTGEMNVNEIKVDEGEGITRTQLINLQHRYDVGGLISQQLQFSLYYFIEEDFLYSVYYPHETYTNYMHGFAAAMLLFICAALAIILLLFPLYFRSALLRPLRALLEGVEKVDRGDWEARVEIHGEDEIGFLGTSFNRMVESVNAYAGDLQISNEKLAEANRTLEQRVTERTRDLQAKNGELEETLYTLGETQEQLFFQEKMASLGGLVAGVAHEINNPIGAVRAASDVSRRCVERIEEQAQIEGTTAALRENRAFAQALRLLRDNNGVTQQASLRIGRIVESLKSFARLDEVEFQLADVHEGLDSVLTLLQSQIAEGIAREDLEHIFDFGFRSKKLF